MVLSIINLIVIAAYGIPVLVYLFRVRPGVGSNQMPALVCGVISAVLLLLPLNLGYRHESVLVIWAGGMTLLLIPQWILWLYAAVKKRPVGFFMLLVPGIMLLATAAAVSNIFAILLSVGYLLAAIRARVMRDDE